ncbi:3'-5' exoribonuclease [Candidatus Pacearchaeota archaeon]|nr:3'-5' exoribonuclease [Candidatus Pacearchaeota archaeon]
MKPVFIDIETSGVDLVRCGIWQIGAIDLNNPKNYFLEESRIDDEDEIINAGNKPVLEVIGKTELELRDNKKQPQKELLSKFFKWFDKVDMKNLASQNPQFDVAMITLKSRKYGLKMPFHYRAFDLHSIAQTIYHNINGKFLFSEGYSKMDLKNVLNLCGMEDNRKAHNALEDAKLGGECFSRLIDGKNLFPEYTQFKIPSHLNITNKK